MHWTIARLFAQGSSQGPSLAVRQASETLLPPIPLYRALLRVHRTLPVEMRSLGDDYVKSEFRRHQKISNPLHIVGFCSEWKMYLDALQADKLSSAETRGKSMDPNLLEKVSNQTLMQFSDEQLYQLYELKLATEEVFDPDRAQSRPHDPEKEDKS
ncbi:hypothetical protein MYAM1_000998 [Malassezia yamatoensis]|uniref:Succinate dehydrogenase assembly factor 3 n=1 Tax=Malassezia yamatoensis TaxID=253288 RepID=A0AAJ5YS47_9BASI|nr:hypothetical protein MYAM1_000998 [Malassezia yamatoensis]